MNFVKEDFPEIVYVSPDYYFSAESSNAEPVLSATATTDDIDADIVATYKLVKVQRKTTKVILEDI